MTPISPPKTGLSPGGSRAQVLTGQYVGVMRSPKGKAKGLWLRCGDRQHGVALPKYLRPMLVRELLPGSAVQVWALQEDDGWRAVDIVPLPDQALPPQADSGLEPRPGPPTTCIQICGKGKCARQGSQVLWRSLQAEVAANPDLQQVSMELVGCMKACRQGPNLRIAATGQMMHRVDLSRARDLLTQC